MVFVGCGCENSSNGGLWLWFDGLFKVSMQKNNKQIKFGISNLGKINIAKNKQFFFFF